MTRLYTILVILLSHSLLVGCAETSRTEQTTSANDASVATVATVPEVSVPRQEEAASTRSSYGYTYGQPSGNRMADGWGNLPEASPVEVQLGGEPVWVVGVPVEDDTAWVVTLEDGRVEAFRLDGGTGSIRPWPVSPDRLPAGQPPAIVTEEESLRLLASSGEEASTMTHPILLSLDEEESLLVLAEDGALFAERGGRFMPIGNPQVKALPDARLVRSPGGRIAVLSDPTGRYAHVVIGDDLEAESVVLLEPTEEGAEVTGRISPESGGVFELISPLWFEGPNNSEELLAITESTAREGSRIAVYDPNGRLEAAGPFIGEPQRWRHLLAAGPFGPNGETEIAATRTPHIGGVVEFYRPNLETGELELVAEEAGYSSHRIYSRNLDTARAGDLDGDGRWELLVPDQSYSELGAIRRGEGGAEVVWTLSVGNTIATNLASATTPDGQISLAAGREDGVLRIWS